MNSDSSKPRRQLYGYSVSSKRYVIYEKTGHDNIKVVEPKAHGLGYLAAPKEEREGEEGNWIAEAWDWLLRSELGLKCTVPSWLDIPAMMPIVISTPNILQRLDPRPFSFLLLPQVDSGGGHPADVDNSRFTLVTSFTSKRSEWLESECINIFDGKVYQLALEQTAELDKVIPRTYAHVLYLYTKHPEAKSLAPDGTPCVVVVVNDSWPSAPEKVCSSSTVLTGPRSPALSRSDMKAPVWDDCCARASHEDEAVTNRTLAK